MDNLQNYKQQWFDFVDYIPHSGQELLHNPPKGEYHPSNNPDGCSALFPHMMDCPPAQSNFNICSLWE